jgi:hypothetical protein
MSRFCLALLVASLSLSAWAGPDRATQEMVGTWRYDVKSISVVVDPKLKHEMEVNPEAKRKGPKLIQDQIQKLRDILTPMRMSFQADGQMFATLPPNKERMRTVWKRKGDTITVISDSKTTPPMVFHLLPGHRRMKMSYFGAGFGTATITAIKM